MCTARTNAHLTFNTVSRRLSSTVAETEIVHIGTCHYMREGFAHSKGGQTIKQSYVRTFTERLCVGGVC